MNKFHLSIRPLSAIIFILYLTQSNSQNLLLNADFESYSDCPDGISQVYKLDDWQSVIISPEYYNCDFVSLSNFPSETESYSGTGFVGFLTSNNDEDGFAEAIGQVLDAPLLPENNYTFSFYAKRTNGGNYANDCAGIEIYGFENGIPEDDPYNHMSYLPGAQYLGFTNVITNVDWEQFTIEFTPLDTINSFGITLESMECGMYVFMDSLNLEAEEIIYVEDFNSESASIRFFPNPTSINSNMTVKSTEIMNQISVFSSDGRLIMQSAPRDKEFRFTMSDAGLYLVVIRDKFGTMSRKIIVQD